MLPFLGMGVLIFIFLFGSDLFIKKTDLNQLSGTIENITQYEYYDSEKIGRGPKTYDVLEIHTANYIVRLSDGFEKKFWDKIENHKNIGEILLIHYSQRLQIKNIIWNPEELIIGKTTILSINDQKTILIWITIGFSIFLCLVIFLEIWLVKTYKILYLRKDQMSDSPLIWEIVKKAFLKE
jgi:hypothetical protein